MLVSGGFLIAAAALRRAIDPNPLVNFRFLQNRNTLILGFGLFSVRFVLLSLVFLVPGFLGVVQGYRALETGHVLAWGVIPVLVAGMVAARLMRRVDGRIVAAAGFVLVGVSALWSSALTSAWADVDFLFPLLLLAAGLGVALVGQIGLIGQQAQESGALQRPMDVLTFAAFFQTVRLFGGQAGTVVMQRFVNQRELFHSNHLGYGVEIGDFLTDERLHSLAAGLLPWSPSLEEAQARAILVFGAQLRRQAYTLAYADAFLLVAAACAAFIVGMVLMKRMKIYYDSMLSELPH
jgi:DHA2 family multidrug resistance protein